jgi:hypothetical protein
MRSLAMIAVLLAACVATAVPSMAAPLPYDCRVTAQSDELRPTIVATSATNDGANTVLDNRASHPIVAPMFWAQLTYVGHTSSIYRDKSLPALFADGGWT